MNDRFKFRCFSRKTKKMYEVDSLHLDSKDGEWVWVHYYNPIYDKDLKIQIVQPNAVIMQSTGLKDKNGKLIYESDIVKIFHVSGTMQGKFFTDVVEWNDLRYRFDTEKYGVFDEDDTYEVIGNIYQNPELLESEV